MAHKDRSRLLRKRIKVPGLKAGTFLCLREMWTFYLLIFAKISKIVV